MIELFNMEITDQLAANGEPVTLPDTEIIVGYDDEISAQLVRSIAADTDRFANIDDDQIRIRSQVILDGLVQRLESVGDPVDGPYARAATQTPALRSFRTSTLAEFQVRNDGEGRTVEAYAVPFDEETEVVDADGHYFEVFRKGAFGRQLKRSGGSDVRVLYNHGLDLFMRPAERFAVPIGTPKEIREDGPGLFTVTRYAKTPLADEILELVREGAIRGQSIQFQRTPAGRGWKRHRNAHQKTGLDVIERLDVNLIEYGPTPFEHYAGAKIVGVRARQMAEQLAHFSDDEREELARLLRTTGPSDGPTPLVPDSASAAETTRELTGLRHEQLVRRHRQRK